MVGMYMDARHGGATDEEALQSVAAGLGEDLGAVKTALRQHVKATSEATQDP